MDPLQIEAFQVFTFKAGLLSALGHDLRFSAGQVTAELTEGRVVANVVVRSLTLDGQMKGRAPEPVAVGARDAAQIMESLGATLRVQSFTEARFEGSVSSSGEARVSVEGELTLAGQTKAVTLRFDVASGSATLDWEFAPSHWGIPPFKGLGGALKLQDRVRVRVQLALPDGPLEDALRQPHHWSTPATAG